MNCVSRVGGLLPMPLALLALLSLTTPCRAAFIARPPCASSGYVLMISEDGTAYASSYTPSDSLTWSNGPCGNVLTSSGHAGGQLVAVTTTDRMCNSVLGVTRSGHVVVGTSVDCWHDLFNGQSIFSLLSFPPGQILAAGSDAVSQVYLISDAGHVFSFFFGATVNPEPQYRGRFTGTLPTSAEGTTWGALKIRYR